MHFYAKRNFLKIWSKMFDFFLENIVLQPIAEVASKNVILRKFGLKFLKIIFLKISPHFLVEDAKICELSFYYQ